MEMFNPDIKFVCRIRYGLSKFYCIVIFRSVKAVIPVFNNTANVFKKSYTFLRSILIKVSNYCKNKILIFEFDKDNDMPVAKLAALQKILQSDFFSAVREVYEHIYQTVDSNLKDEGLKASATAKV